MDFSERIKDLARRSKAASNHALTEEATKTSVVLPFIQALGFDIFNLEEVVPEFVADVGVKRGEKVDFALKIGGKVAALIEVKPISSPLGSASSASSIDISQSQRHGLRSCRMDGRSGSSPTWMSQIAWTRGHSSRLTCSPAMKDK